MVSAWPRKDQDLGLILLQWPLWAAEAGRISPGICTNLPSVKWDVGIWELSGLVQFCDPQSLRIRISQNVVLWNQDAWHHGDPDVNCFCCLYTEWDCTCLVLDSFAWSREQYIFTLSRQYCRDTTWKCQISFPFYNTLPKLNVFFLHQVRRWYIVFLLSLMEGTCLLPVLYPLCHKKLKLLGDLAAPKREGGW